MLHRPVTPDREQELRHSIAALREKELSLYIAGNKAEAQQCSDDAARLERSMKRGHAQSHG